MERPPVIALCAGPRSGGAYSIPVSAENHDEAICRRRSRMDGRPGSDRFASGRRREPDHLYLFSSRRAPFSVGRYPARDIRWSKFLRSQDGCIRFENTSLISAIHSSATPCMETANTIDSSKTSSLIAVSFSRPIRLSWIIPRPPRESSSTPSGTTRGIRHSTFSEFARWFRIRAERFSSRRDVSHSHALHARLAVYAKPGLRNFLKPIQRNRLLTGFADPVNTPIHSPQSFADFHDGSLMGIRKVRK